MGELVTGNYFQHLGVRAQLGRTLLPSDEVAPGQHPVVVLSDALWRRHFGAIPTSSARPFELNAYPLTVVGVAAPSFHGTIVSFDVEVFVPVMMAPQIGLSGTRDPRTILADQQASFADRAGPSQAGRDACRTRRHRLAVLSTQLRRRRDSSMRSRTSSRSSRFWQSPFGAQTYMLPAVDRVERDGGAVAADCLREHRRTGARARHFAARRDRAPPGPRREPCADPAAAVGRKLRAGGAWRAWRCRRRSCHPSCLLIGTPMVTRLRCASFFNLSVDRPGHRSSRAGAPAAAPWSSACCRRCGSSRVDLLSVMKEDALAARRGAGTLSRGLSSRRWLSRCCCWSAPDWSREASTPRGMRTRDSMPPTWSRSARCHAERLRRDARPRVLRSAARRVRAPTPASSRRRWRRTTPLTLVDTGPAQVAIDGYAPRRDEDLTFLSNIVAPDYFRTLQHRLVAGREFEEPRR